MKLLLSLCLLILNLNYVLSQGGITTIYTSFISSANGNDGRGCGKTFETACQSLSGTINSLEFQYNRSKLEYPNELIFNISPGEYTNLETINVDGIIAIFQRYLNETVDTTSEVYFNGGETSSTWFTSSYNLPYVQLTFIDISSNDCTVSGGSGGNSFFYQSNGIYSSDVYPYGNLTFINSNFNCGNITNSPLISVSNGTITSSSLLVDYDFDESDYFSINFINSTFNYDKSNIFNIQYPTTLSIYSSTFNLNDQLDTFNSSGIPFINFNNGVLKIVDSTFDIINNKISILNSNNTQTIIRNTQIGKVNIQTGFTDSTYENNVITLNSSLVEIDNLNVFAVLNSKSGVSLVSIENSFGIIQSTTLKSTQFLDSSTSTIQCKSTYLLYIEQSNVYLNSNEFDGCGSAVYLSNSNIAVSGNTFGVPYFFTPMFTCNSNTVTVTGKDARLLPNQCNLEPVTIVDRKPYIIGMSVLGAVAAILAIIVIILIVVIKKRGPHYRSIHH